jgi:hypothetical protein
MRGTNQRPPMKKKATRKHKGLKSKTSNEKRRRFYKPKIINHYLTDASLAKLMLEGEGDAFRFHLKHETLAANRMKVIS